MNTYRHTQFGTVNVAIIIAIAPLTFLPAWVAGAAPIAWLILIFLLGILVLFHNLTVTIDARIPAQSPSMAGTCASVSASA